MNFSARINNIKEFKEIISNEPYYNNPILPFSQEKDYQDLAAFFKGKRVAIVGPAPDLIKQNKGKEIDSYDIVCKVGSMYTINDPENYGSRMDVLFNGCFSTHYKLDDFKNHNIKRIICPIKTCIPNLLDVHRRDIYGFYNKLKNYHRDICFNNISLFSCYFDNVMKTRATLGSFAILFLLNMDLKELGIYGFTWLFGKEQYNKQYYVSDKRDINPHGTPMKIEALFIKQLLTMCSFKITYSVEVKNILDNLH